MENLSVSYADTHPGLASQVKKGRLIRPPCGEMHSTPPWAGDCFTKSMNTLKD